MCSAKKLHAEETAQHPSGAHSGEQSQLILSQRVTNPD
jgi:hypothetical protein